MELFFAIVVSVDICRIGYLLAITPFLRKNKRRNHLHMEAIMLAVARWFSENQRAAILVGAKMTRG